MSAYPIMPTLPREPEQPTLPGILAPVQLPKATVDPLPCGNARLLFNGACVGLYPNEARATEGKAMFARMGLCEVA